MQDKIQVHDKISTEELTNLKIMRSQIEFLQEKTTTASLAFENTMLRLFIKYQLNPDQSVIDLATGNISLKTQ